MKLGFRVSVNFVVKTLEVGNSEGNINSAEIVEIRASKLSDVKDQRSPEEGEIATKRAEQNLPNRV